MYGVMLLLHSWLRWAVFAGALLSVVIAVMGLAKKTAPQPPDVKKVRIHAVLFDIQAVLGLVLYGALSPVTHAAFADMGAAMKDANLRFWSVEHLAMMLVAWVCARMGAVFFKRATEPKGYRTLLVFSGVSLLCILAAIPWPMRAIGRELFRTSF